MYKRQLEISLIILADIGLSAVFLNCVIEEHTLVINNTVTCKVIGGGVCALHYGFCNVVAVNCKVKSLADILVVEGRCV